MFCKLVHPSNVLFHIQVIESRISIYVNDRQFINTFFSIESNDDESDSDDNLKQLPRLIRIAKKTKSIVLQNIIFASLIKLTFLTLGSLGITGMLVAVFADVGVTLLTILNSLRVLFFKLKK